MADVVEGDVVSMDPSAVRGSREASEGATSAIRERSIDRTFDQKLLRVKISATALVADGVSQVRSDRFSVG